MVHNQLYNKSVINKTIKVNEKNKEFKDIVSSCMVISDSIFDACSFTHATRFNCVLVNVKFINCKFDFSSFVMCTFKDVTFVRCKFTNSKFLDSIFDNVYLSGISRDMLIDCKFDETLKLNGSLVVPYLKCPESGSFIGYKKCISKNGKKILIVKLLIPEDAKRTSSYESKCRASYVKVLEIKGLDGTSSTEAYSAFDETEYKVGEYVYPDKYDDSCIKVCTNGIHFFLSRQEAIDY